MNNVTGLVMIVIELYQTHAQDCVRIECITWERDGRRETKREREREGRRRY